MPCGPSSASLPSPDGRPALDPREAGAEVGLVRRLVAREARVPVDPERRPLGVRDQRDAAGLEPFGERDHQQLHRLLDQALEVGLARLEPRPVVVGGEVRHELDALGGEPREGRCDGHLAPPAAPGVYAGNRRRPFTGPTPMRSCRDEPRLPQRDGRLPGAAADHDRPVRAHDGGRVLEARAARRPGDLHAVLPPRAVRWRVHARRRPRGRRRLHRALPLLAPGARAPRGPRRQRRPAAVRARLPRLPRGPAADGRRRRHARGDARVPARAAPPGHGSPAPGRSCSRARCSTSSTTPPSRRRRRRTSCSRRAAHR